MEKQCICEEWKEGMPQIEAQAIFCGQQTAGPLYTASVFKFCPWCGDEIFELVDCPICNKVKIPPDYEYCIECAPEVIW